MQNKSGLADQTSPGKVTWHPSGTRVKSWPRPTVSPRPSADAL